MNFLQNTFNGRNGLGWYFLGLVIIAIAWQGIGSLPVSVYMIVGGFANHLSLQEIGEAAGAMDFERMGCNKNIGYALLLLSFLIGWFGVFISVRFIHKRKLISAITVTHFRWGHFAAGFFLWGFLLCIAEFVMYLITPGNYQYVFNLQKFIPVFIVSILLIPIQSSFEEVFMRGYLMQALYKGQVWKLLLGCLPLVPLLLIYRDISMQHSTNFILYVSLAVALLVIALVCIFVKPMALVINRFFELPLVPVVITGLIFGLLHSMNPEVSTYGFWKTMPFYIGFGIFAGLIAVLDNGLEIPMGLHIANNLYGSLLVTFPSSTLATDTIFSVKQLDIDSGNIATLCAYLLVLILLGLVYKWNTWRHLLLRVPDENTSADDESN